MRCISSCGLERRREASSTVLGMRPSTDLSSDLRSTPSSMMALPRAAPASAGLSSGASVPPPASPTRAALPAPSSAPRPRRPPAPACGSLLVMASEAWRAFKNVVIVHAVAHTNR